jgi:hypothetical protein
MDNITILGVEAILLDKIKGLLSYEDVAQLRGDRLADIAAEPPGAQEERSVLSNSDCGADRSYSDLQKVQADRLK